MHHIELLFLQLQKLTCSSCLLGFYRPQTKLRKGNVFTSVCQEFCPRGGVQAQAQGGLQGGVQAQAQGVSRPRPRPRGVCIPACTEADTPQQTATAADGTHPTGMHSC